MRLQSSGLVRRQRTSVLRILIAFSISQFFTLTSNAWAGEKVEDPHNYLEQEVNLSCTGLENFDFIFEAGRLVGEWCRAQNEKLGENGCGIDSEMCLEQFVRADRPGYSLSVSIGAAYTKGSAAISGTDVVFGDSRWVSSSDAGRIDDSPSVSSWATNLNYNRLQILFGIGVEFPLSPQTIVRKTCVNPLASDYLEMLINSVLHNTPAIQKFSKNCNLKRKL